jgi:hypothetical protein
MGGADIPTLGNGWCGDAFEWVRALGHEESDGEGNVSAVASVAGKRLDNFHGPDSGGSVYQIACRTARHVRAVRDRRAVEL